MADLARGRREGGRCLQLDRAVRAQGVRRRRIIDKINAETVKILSLPDIKERFAGGGVDTSRRPAAELDARVKREFERFAAIVQKANIRPD